MIHMCVVYIIHVYIYIYIYIYIQPMRSEPTDPQLEPQITSLEHAILTKFY